METVGLMRRGDGSPRLGGSRVETGADTGRGRRVPLDELAPGLDGIAHEGGERAVGRGGVFDGDLLEHPAVRIHRGGPELLGVHLAETLVALDADAARVLAAQLRDGLRELVV